jgi:segregation and condensation protein A
MDEEPVEILLKMAESGAIDPWNIDIIEVTDRFLSELDRMKKLDLKISGRTLFFASSLLRMKSDFMEEPEEPPESEEDDFGGFGEGFDDFSDDEASANPIDRFEREIQRRIKRKDHRKRPVTLYELIKQLKTAEKMFRRRQRRSSPDAGFFLEAEDVVSVAHEEDFADDAARVFSSYGKLAPNGEKVGLRALCEDMNTDLRSVYLPLLFLMLDGRLVLYQEEFYGDIFVTLPTDEFFDDADEEEPVKKSAAGKPRKRSKSKTKSGEESGEKADEKADDKPDEQTEPAEGEVVDSEDNSKENADDDADEGMGEFLGNVY